LDSLEMESTVAIFSLSVSLSELTIPSLLPLFPVSFVSLPSTLLFSQMLLLVQSSPPVPLLIPSLSISPLSLSLSVQLPRLTWG
jgi:hypothetical protein